MPSGTFVISLDFELHWGSLEVVKKIDSQSISFFDTTKRQIPALLELFEQKELHATWATVGMLYNKDKKEWYSHVPKQTPQYRNKQVSTYEWVSSNGFTDEAEVCHFAPELIDLIYRTPFQEVGTHTYSHYFCLEEGQTKDQFREDLRLACQLAKENGYTIRSLVFPCNQFNQEYLEICRDYGITSVRTNPDIWYWSYSDKGATADENIFKRIVRGADAFLKFQPIKMQYVRDFKLNQLPLHLPASRLYRPWTPVFPIKNKFKLKRILDEMTQAAMKGGYYHLWWHPENLGQHPEECLKEIDIIADHYLYLKEKFGFESLNMGELTQRILTQT